MKTLTLFLALLPLQLLGQGSLSLSSSQRTEKNYHDVLQSFNARQYRDALITMESIMNNQYHDSLSGTYAYLLELDGQYNRAAKYYDKASQYNPSEFYNTRKASCLKFTPDTSKTLTAMQAISENTTYDDFCGFIYNESLVQVSSRPVNKLIKKSSKNEHLFRYYDEKGNLITSFTLHHKYFHDGPACFDPNTGQFYFTHNQQTHKLNKHYSRVPLKIYYADVDSNGIKHAKPFEWNSKKYSVAHPAISPKGDLLVFASDNPEGTGKSDLYICSRTSSGWNTPKNIGTKINTAGNELFPYFSNDSTLIFSSNGHFGMGGLDLYAATFEKGTIKEVKHMGTPINSSKDDFAYLELNDSISYFSSNRNNSTGDDIYRFQWREQEELLEESEPEAPATITKQLINATTEEPIQDVKAVHATPTDSLVSISNEDGEIQLLPTKEGTLTLSKPGFITQTIPVNPITKEVLTPTKMHEVKKGMLIEIENIYYEYNSHFITHLAQPPLDSLVKIMVLNPSLTIEISSHTDARGSKKYNEELSLNRAKEVVKYLNSKGIDKQRLYIRFFGEENLVNDCGDSNDCDEYDHSKNRRTEFRVLNF